MNIIIYLLLIVYIGYKQMKTRKIKTNKFTIMPLIFITLFCYVMWKISPNIKNINALIPGMLIVASIGIIFGVISGKVSSIFRGENKELYQKGGIKAILVFGIMIGSKRLLIYELSHLEMFKALIANSGISTLVLVMAQSISRSMVMLNRIKKVS